LGAGCPLVELASEGSPLILGGHDPLQEQTSRVWAKREDDATDSRLRRLQIHALSHGQILPACGSSVQSR
jgi:hypothetical protein